MSSRYTPGDVVQLNSGGPKMTVSEIDGDTVYCEWFIEGDVRRGSFKAAMLKKPSSAKAYVGVY